MTEMSYTYAVSTICILILLRKEHKMAEIILDKVSKTYNGREVLKDVSFTLNNGMYSLRGENGCGKTTLLNMIANYLSPDKGAIKTNGSLFYVFQDETFFSNLSLTDNLVLFLNAHQNNSGNTRERILEALKYLNIEHLADQMISSLSGGERQKAELAKLYLYDPDIILMDEPTARLDNSAKKEISDIVVDLCKDKLLMIVSHDHELFTNFTQLRINDGGLEYAQ